MPILLNDNLDIKAPRPTDNRYGPYASTAAALAAIPSAQRYIGLTVGVLGVGSLVEEYWFNDGILDTDFVLKAFGSTSDSANAAYAQANAARDQANTARSDANTTFATINTTFGTINTNISTVYSQANAAYDAANNAKVTVYQNSATVATTQKINFINTSTITVVTQNDNGNANVGFIAVGGAAYDQANAAYNAANNAANTVRVSGNSGATLSSKQLNFVNTSTALVTISDSLNGNANISIDVIGGGAIGLAYDQANAAYAQANAARLQANTARSDANTTFATINTTFSTLNTNITTANTQANAARDQANTARNDANTTFATINTTFATINTNTGIVYAQANAAYNEANLKLNLTGGTVSGDLTVQGNLFLTGNATYINVATLKVNDSIIQLSSNSIADALDIGFVGHYSEDSGTTNLHAGFIRHASDNVFYIFDGYPYEPTNNVIDIASANLAWLRANVNAASLLLQGNVVATQANLTLAHNQANSASDQANTARDQANAARDQANTARSDANTTFATINTTFSTINTTFSTLNTNTGIVYAQANAARDQANAAYNQANAARDQANTARSDANTTFATINTTFSTLNTNIGVAYSQANTAYDQANAAYGQANTAYGQANLAYSQANSARDQANTAYDQANNARDQANTARDQANTAYGQANLAYAQANSAANTVRVSQNSGSTLSAKQLNFVNTGNIIISLTDSGDGNANVYLYTSNVGGETVIGIESNTLTAQATVFYLSQNVYNINRLSVSKNGLRLIPSTHYTLANNNEVTLTSTAEINDEVLFEYFYDISGIIDWIVAYDQANAAYNQANSAYNAANNAKVTVFQNSASAVTTQNINFVNTSTITVSVENIGGNANVGFIAVGGAAYDQANAAYNQANNAANTVSVSANGGSTLSARKLNFVNTSTIAVSVTDPGSSNANIQFEVLSGGYSIINSDVFSANGACTQFTLTYNSDTDRTFVYIDGVSQKPEIDYQVAVKNLSFNVAPPANTTIEVRTVTSLGNITNVTSISSDQFVGNGACTQYTLSTSSLTTNSVFVFVDGVTQVPSSDYTISGNVITFTSAPENGGAIEVRSLSGLQLFQYSNSIVEGSTTLKVSESKLELFSNGFSTANDSISRTYLLRGTTTDGNEKEILLSNGSRIPVSTNTTVFYTADIVGRRTDATGESAGYYVKGVVDDYSGSVADIGTLYEVVVAEDDVDWSVDARADDTNNTINIYVTGETAKTIRWTAVVKTVEVAG
jgi:predicted  nucleic acid-binding Zn-ribbon protein